MFVQVQTFSISWFWGILDFLQEKFHYINYRANAEIKRSDLMCQVTWPINQSEWTIKHSLVALLIKFVYDVISCHVYIFCLLQTLSAPLWFIWPIFSPDIQADFVALPISPVLVPPPHLGQFWIKTILIYFTVAPVSLVVNSRTAIIFLTHLQKVKKVCCCFFPEWEQSLAQTGHSSSSPTPIQ